MKNDKAIYTAPEFQPLDIEQTLTIMGSVQGSSTETLEEENFEW